MADVTTPPPCSISRAVTPLQPKEQFPGPPCDLGITIKVWNYWWPASRNETDTGWESRTEQIRTETQRWIFQVQSKIVSQPTSWVPCESDSTELAGWNNLQQSWSALVLPWTWTFHFCRNFEFLRTFYQHLAQRLGTHSFYDSPRESQSYTSNVRACMFSLKVQQVHPSLRTLCSTNCNITFSAECTVMHTTTFQGTGLQTALFH